MVHDHTHEIDFSKEADRVYTFRNVRPDTKFSIKAFDDDLIGYEQIEHTNRFTAGKIETPQVLSGTMRRPAPKMH